LVFPIGIIEVLT